MSKRASITVARLDVVHVEGCACETARHPFEAAESTWQRVSGGYERTTQSAFGTVTYRVQKRSELSKDEKWHFDRAIGLRDHGDGRGVPRKENWVILANGAGRAQAYDKKEALAVADGLIAESERLAQLSQQRPRGPSLGLSQSLAQQPMHPFEDSVVDTRFDAKHNRGSGFGAAEEPGAGCVVIRGDRIERTAGCMPTDVRLESDKDVYRIMRPLFEKSGWEAFYIVGSSIQSEMVGQPVLVALGQTSGVRVSVEQCLVAALGLKNGAAVDFWAVHGHPSESNDEHSSQDKELTKKIRKGFEAALPESKFRGHIVCGRDGFTVS